MKINEKNLRVFATSPPFDKQGFLNKRGDVNKYFQRRYFVLKGNLLFYFEKQGDKEPLGLIIVEGCTIELSENNDQYCFEIAFNGNRTYVLSADTQENMESWMKALTCASYEYKKIMVAELQRQLEEIVEAKNKMLMEMLTTGENEALPKRPPRRQNPFNRPITQFQINSKDLINKQTSFINQHYLVSQPSSKVSNSPAGQYTSSPLPPPRCCPPMVTTTATTTTTTAGASARSEFYIPTQNKPTGHQAIWNKPDSQTTSCGNVFLKLENHNNASKVIKFADVHEKFRQIVMQDIWNYHQQRELKTRPLIDL